jgi:outer membrane immunogenic protein
VLKKLLVASIAFTALIAGSATAADLARPVYRRPVVVAPPPVSSWSGIYVGLEGGYGWGKQSTDAISPGDQFSPVIINGSGTSTLQPPLLFFPDVAVPSINQKGWLFGGFFGAQKQWGNWVLGIEGDIDGANIKESVTSNATSFSSNRVTFAGGGGGFGIPCVSGPCFTLNHNVSIDSKIDVLASLRGKVG